MFCPNCGSQAPDGVKFCSKCGKAMPGGVGNGNLTGNVGNIVQAAGPASMAGKQPAAGEGEKGKKLGKWGIIILALVAGVIGVVLFATSPGRLTDKIETAKRNGATSLDLSGYNTSRVTDMMFMFSHCSSFTELDLSSFDTSRVTSMFGMFFECSSLEELDLSSFDTGRVTSMASMFLGCSSLEELDLSSFDTSRVTDMGLMFDGCSSLKTVYLGDDWTYKWTEYVKDTYPDINFVMK